MFQSNVENKSNLVCIAIDFFLNPKNLDKFADETSEKFPMHIIKSNQF